MKEHILLGAATFPLACGILATYGPALVSIRCGTCHTCVRVYMCINLCVLEGEEEEEEDAMACRHMSIAGFIPRPFPMSMAASSCCAICTNCFLSPTKCTQNQPQGKCAPQLHVLPNMVTSPLGLALNPNLWLRVGQPL